jgi:hypothetical protein
MGFTPNSYSPGDWKAACFRCGGTRKASEMRKQWQGFYVCATCWEPRHPQDFVKGVPDDPSVPWSQPEVWTYVGPDICTPIASTAIPGYAGAGCAIPSKVDGLPYL